MSESNKIKNWAKRHKFLSAIIIIVVIIIIGNAMGGEKENKPAQTNQEGGQQTAVQVEESKEKIWTSVFKTIANSDKQTESFELKGGQQKVVYKNTGGSYSICMIYVVKEGDSLEKSGGFPIASITGDQEDETMMRKSKGQYYLDLKTANGACEVEIQELR